MDALRLYQNILLKKASTGFLRFQYEKINWNQRMLAIKGPRGSGKTTLMLQRLKKGHKTDQALYITLDHPYFFNNSLFEFTQDFYNLGGRFLFVDEVHKYSQWSRELKVIYDGFPDLRVAFTASSALDIYKGEADLSRRVITYDLPGLSFREFLELTGRGHFPVFSLHEIVERHEQITRELLSNNLIPLLSFKEYLKSGYLPILLESKGNEYLLRLNQIINAVIDSDMSYADGYSAGTALKVKKLLGILAESAPFKPNITSIARKIDIGRDYVYTYIKHLENARLINLLHKKGKGVSLLQKPEKLYMENTNLSYALKTSPEIGTIRETFLLNQLINANLPVEYPVAGDFQSDDLIVEVGGKDKTARQLKGVKGAIIAADDIESGYSKKVPLWLFGFLY